MKHFLRTLLFLLIASPLLHAQNFNLELRSEISYNYSCASIWGYAVNGREYALVGTYKGVSIVDVTDPDNPNDIFDVVHQGAASEWREIKTYSHYAYATNETGNGLLIIDLADLPNSYTQYTFTYTDGQGNTQQSGHTLWIDEQGRLFIFGGNYSNGGYTCFDLTVDPLNPPFLGKYENHYIHDGFERGDTLWASEIYDGQVEVLNVADPSNPVSMASWHTPNNFSHNSWPTHDDHYVFTTDEVDNSYLTSYDVSDFNNITELDRVQSNPGSDVIIHNVHLLNDTFAVVAYYKDGVVLFDVSHPDNMVEVGSYDTDPNESGGNYGGTWGVYPYLPSGNIIASDLSDAGAVGGKLSVLTPTYVQACWLVGLVTDSSTSAPINNAYTEILTTQNTDYSDLSGNYKTGNGIPGVYTVRVSKPGYFTKEIQNVTLTSGVQTTLNVQLVPLVSTTISGQVVDSATNAGIQGATVEYDGVSGFQYNVTTDVNGNYSFTGYPDTYNIYAGKWGHHETGVLQDVVGINPASQTLKIRNGYYDDYALDFGWSEVHTASSGIWTRAEPIGTYAPYSYIQANPEVDYDNDWSDECYMTGNGGGSTGTDDVDNGTVTLTSPVMDLTGYADAVISFYGWFANSGGQGNPNDSLNVYLTDGNTTVKTLTITAFSNPQSQWNYYEFHVNDFMTPGPGMQVKFKSGDLPNSGHIVEAGVDLFRADDALGTDVTSVTTSGNVMHAYPNPFNSFFTVSYHFKQPDANTRLELYNLVGNLVSSHQITSDTGSWQVTESLPAGVYFVHAVENGKVTGVMKVVKQD